MKNVVLGLHPKQTIALAQKYFVDVANKSQNEILLKTVNITYSDRTPFFMSDNRVHVRDIISSAHHLKKKKLKLSNDTLFIMFFDALAYDEEDEDLFFVTTEPYDQFEAPGIAIISTRYTHTKVLGKAPTEVLVANSVLLNLLATIACFFTEADTHMETTGCVLDYCDTMEDIRYSLRKGFPFCSKQGCRYTLEATSIGRAILQVAVSLSMNRITKESDLKKLIKIEESGDMMYVNPIWRGRNFRVNPKLCFVLMPFKKRYSDRMWRILQQIIRRAGMTPKRADNFTGRLIMEDIWAGINQARIVIADLTDMNPNVFYELGITHTTGQSCILLAQDRKWIPFDLNAHRVVLYQDNDDGYKILRQAIPSYISNIMEVKSN